jgi:hypothetical protein
MVLNMGAGPDTNGIAWIIEKLEGWDGPDVVGQVIQKAADHGAYPAAQFFGPRMMTLTLRASAPDQATRDLARSILGQVIPVNDLCAFNYNEPIPKVAYVRRSGKITEQYDNLCEVVFSILLVAPDPRKYSQTIYASGSASSSAASPITIPVTVPFTLNNGVVPGSIQFMDPGNFPSFPEMTIWGPLKGPAITLVQTGQTVTWWNQLVTLQTGDRMVIDFDAKQSFLNGVYVPADVSSSWFTINPGFNTVIVSSIAGAAGGQLVAAYQAAWI